MAKSTSKLQQKAALRASDLLAGMGSPTVPLAGADERTMVNFTGKPYANPYAAAVYPAAANLNQATQLATETRAMNRRRGGRMPSKGGF